jgi:DeoR/GlpR family transcriptional regulator of sugar metabolism
MFAIERRQAIIDYLKEKKSVTVKELSEKFFIGEATIRRDLEKIEKEGIISRTYGGAVLVEGTHSEVPLSVRETDRKAEKEIIAKLASKYIRNGDIIIMDSSSTAMMMIDEFSKSDDLTVITNGAKTAVSLAQQTSFKVYATGGQMRENTLTYYGESANEFIEKFNADTLFFSCRALSIEKGITDPNEEEAKLKRLMISSSQKSVLLVDHAKFNASTFCKIGDIGIVDVIITDEKPDDAWDQYLKENQIELVYQQIE